LPYFRFLAYEFIGVTNYKLQLAAMIDLFSSHNTHPAYRENFLHSY